MTLTDRQNTLAAEKANIEATVENIKSVAAAQVAAITAQAAADVAPYQTSLDTLAVKLDFLLELLADEAANAQVAQ